MKRRFHRENGIGTSEETGAKLDRLAKLRPRSRRVGTTSDVVYSDLRDVRRYAVTRVCAGYVNLYCPFFLYFPMIISVPVRRQKWNLISLTLRYYDVNNSQLYGFREFWDCSSLAHSSY